MIVNQKAPERAPTISILQQHVSRYRYDIDIDDNKIRGGEGGPYQGRPTRPTCTST